MPTARSSPPCSIRQYRSAQWVFFSYIPDATGGGINPQRGLVVGGVDNYEINIATRQVIGLTQQVWTPAVGDTYWVRMQTAPTPLAGTKVTLNDSAPAGDRYTTSRLWRFCRTRMAEHSSKQKA